MLRLVKYEIRKNRALLLSMVAAVALLEGYFAGSMLAKSDANIIASFSLFPLAGMFLALTVFIMGVSSYSRELSQKSSYLIFMTPTSALAVISSKVLFTLIAGLFFAAALVALLIANAPLIVTHFGEWSDVYDMIRQYASMAGIDLNNIWMTALSFVLTVFLVLLAALAIAYLAVTLSATFLQNKKGKGILSAVLFWLLCWLFTWLNERIATVDSLARSADVLRAAAPQMLLSAATILICLFASAWMLERKVSL